VRKPFVVIRKHGPDWDESRPIEAQPEWPAHAAFMDDLAAEGFVVFAGPLEGARKALVVIRAESASEIERRLADDPWTRSRLLITEDCWPWTIRLGSLT
jgi:uncharacterized protein YciI